MAKKIALDCGHGLKTAGKQTPDGIKEWTLNDKVRDKVVELLKGYDVEFVFPDNNEGTVDEGLSARKNMYIAKGVDVAVSIHHNAYTGTWNNATGVEVYTDKNETSKDRALAEAIYKRLVEYTGLKGRGIKEENWAVINQNSIPAVLVEGGFMDSNIDYKVITSDAGQNAYARAVAEGLIEFLGLAKTEVKEEPKKDLLTVDGEWGRNTTTKTQKVFGTIADGEVSHQDKDCKLYLENCLTSSWEFDGTGKGSALIRKIQGYLNDKGYNCGKEDGLCGKKTVMAIQKFLNDRGFNCGTVDGCMGEKTVKAWQKYINSRL